MKLRGADLGPVIGRLAAAVLPSRPRAAGAAKTAGPGRSPAAVRSGVRILAVASAATAVTAVVALAPGGPAARAAFLTQPAITVADGNSVIAVQTGDNGLRFYWNEHGTSTWHAEQVATDDTTFSAPAIAQVGTSVVIAAQGAGNSLDFY